MENDDYHIRRCLPDDVPALVALQQRWAAEENIIDFYQGHGFQMWYVELYL